MNMKTTLTMTAAAFLLAGFAPSDAVARPGSNNGRHGGNYKHNNYKRNYKHNNYKHHGHGHGHSYHSSYKYYRPNYNRSSFSIYGSPYGGLGFSYSEFNGRPYSPYRPYYGYF